MIKRTATRIDKIAPAAANAVITIVKNGNASTITRPPSTIQSPAIPSHSVEMLCLLFLTNEREISDEINAKTNNAIVKLNIADPIPTKVGRNTAIVTIPIIKNKIERIKPINPNNSSSGL